MVNSTAKNQGFTLIELLVAITILGIVAVLGWRGLDSIVRARVALTEDMEQTRGMQLAFAQLQSDCEHAANPNDLAGRTTLAADQTHLTMVRTVFADSQASKLQVVAYRIKDGVLSRRESMATRDLKVLDKLWQAALADSDTNQPVMLQTGVMGMVVQTWFNDSPGWRVTTGDAVAAAGISIAAGTATGAPSAPGAALPGAAAIQVAAPSGLEVALQLKDRQTSMTKIFLLGAV